MNHPLQDLITQLEKLPGVGPKSAQRLAFFLLGLPEKEVAEMAESMLQTRRNIRYCRRCFNISLTDECLLCQDPSRDAARLCVVAEPKDVFAIERTGEYLGRYHVLGGVISPLDGIYPEVLRIRELIQRLQTETHSEIILAINPTIEGDATVLYLRKLLQPLNLRMTQLAYGLPIGADIDYADELTLRKAVLGRREFS